MQLLHGFVPKETSLEALVERRAREVAIQIVQRTAHKMQLDDQANSAQRLEAAIQEKAEEIKWEVPKFLLD